MGTMVRKAVWGQIKGQFFVWPREWPLYYKHIKDF